VAIAGSVQVDEDVAMSPTAKAEPIVAHPDVAERAAAGKAVRRSLPRAAHAVWEAPGNRRSPVEILQAQATTRVPDLVPLRYGRMLVSAFTFYRGAAAIMAADLAGQPHTGLVTQLCGDAHLSNFGAFAAPDRSLVFDVNDFDETLPGPFEWDVKRLVVSFAVAGRDRGFDATQRAVINETVARAYREAMASYATLGNLDLWYSRMDVDELVGPFLASATAKQRARAEKNLAKTRAKTSLRAFEKLTETVDGELRIRTDSPVIVRVHDLAGPEHADEVDGIVRRMVRAYRATLTPDRRKLLERYRYVDAARKVVGVGSVGTRAWIMLLLGRDEGDPLFLQFKEAEASVLEPHLGRSTYRNHGRRVVEGQRLTQAAGDVMLGWLRVAGPDSVDRDYYVRQLWDSKGSALVELMNADVLAAYGQACGHALARAHARAGDPVAISGYLGRGTAFDRALSAYAEAYAEQNEQDYTEMQAAVADGTIPAQPGV
jgi:uncharacterized protein (DUF2252 family)